MALRSTLITIIACACFFTVKAQPAGNLAGTYVCKSACVECDYTITRLKLAAGDKAGEGTYILTKTKSFDDASRELYYKSTGNWHLLKNIVPGDNTTIIVVDINYGDEPETYPLYMLKSDGNLLELNDQFVERYPKYLYTDSATKKMYIARENGRPLALKKALRYKDADKDFIDPALDHTFKKQ